MVESFIARINLNKECRRNSNNKNCSKILLLAKVH